MRGLHRCKYSINSSEKAFIASSGYNGAFAGEHYHCLYVKGNLTGKGGLAPSTIGIQVEPKITVNEGAVVRAEGGPATESSHV